MSLSDHALRVVQALEANKGVLLPTINQLMAEAWAEGFKQGGPMHDEHHGEPDKHTINPYTQPKPIPKTIDERFAFEQAWDAKVEANTTGATK